MRNRGTVLIVGCVLAAVLLLPGRAAAKKVALLEVSAGQVPNDTGSDGATKMTLEDSAELGGKALKVVFAPGDSLGDRQARVGDWKPFLRLEFQALNPAKEDVRLTLTVRHKRTTSYQTRVDHPIVLKPGKNSFRIGVDELVNVNGSAPDLSAVGKWYLACEEGKAPTVYIGDIWLVGDDAAPAPLAPPAPAGPAGPARAYRVTGKIGDMPVDLVITPIPVEGPPAGGAAGPQTGGTGAPVAAKPAPAALLHVTRGQIPNDTGSDGGTGLVLEDKPELGGMALKITFASGDSFGDSMARVKDWKPFEALEFTVLNPGKEDVRLTLTVKHKRTTSFQTRVDVPFVVKPGKSTVRLPVDQLSNTDGSLPDLSHVVRWYIACEEGHTPTLYLGDIWLVPPGAAPPKAAAAPSDKAISDPARLARIRAAKMPKITQPVMFNTPEADAICSALEVFPPDNPWNEVISDRPVHANSKNLIASAGADKKLQYNLDMCFILVPPDQKRVEVKYPQGAYVEESDKGPMPIPDNAPVEGWPLWPPGVQLDKVQREGTGDRHVMVVDPVNRMLYEMFVARRAPAGWTCIQSTIWDLKTNDLRPAGWTSVDAAGLPIFPAAIRYDECERGIVEHAMRFTVQKTRREYVYPATHFASSHEEENYPRMGERYRLRADFDVSGFSPHVQAILKGLKKYGMFVADNGGDWRISVAPDERIKGLEDLKRVYGRDFEVIVPTGPFDGRRAMTRKAK